VFGTRPKAIKMASVVKSLETYPDDVESRVCVTAQHREMLDQVLDLFAIEPDYDLDLMRPDHSLDALTARVFAELDSVLQTGTRRRSSRSSIDPRRMHRPSPTRPREGPPSSS
jgi:UDP-N-acetylglucosamine 2-epimerase (non-hydrolysing)